MTAPIRLVNVSQVTVDELQAQVRDLVHTRLELERDQRDLVRQLREAHDRIDDLKREQRDLRQDVIVARARAATLEAELAGKAVGA